MNTNPQPNANETVQRFVPRPRRAAADVRLELMPLLDVVFLLLTFFIYAMAVMVRVEALEVGLSPVAGSSGPGGSVQHVLRIEPTGDLSYNNQPLDADTLPTLLTDLANDDTQPRLFVALTESPNAAAARIDRGVVMWEVLQAIEAASLQNVAIVGRPANIGNSGTPTNPGN